MNTYDLDSLSEYFLTFLYSLRNSIFNEEDFIKNFPNPPKKIQNYIKKYPMPPSHFRVILYLEKSKSSSISQIAKNLQISKPNMTPIIDKLIEYDLVKRVNDPSDRRIIRIELTSKAESIFEDYKQCAKSCIINKISTLGTDDLDLLKESFININTILKKLNDN